MSEKCPECGFAGAEEWKEYGGLKVKELHLIGGEACLRRQDRLQAVIDGIREAWEIVRVTDRISEKHRNVIDAALAEKKSRPIHENIVEALKVFGPNRAKRDTRSRERRRP